MSTAHRQQRLREFGVIPYRLRAAQAHGPAPESMAVVPDRTAVASAAVDCVLVLPAGCEARLLDLVGRAMQAFGPAFARAPRVSPGGGGTTVPAARAYLAFGEEQARALGRELPAAWMAGADVVLLDPPQQLVHAAAKRRLWSAINALRRRWRAQQAGE